MLYEVGGEASAELRKAYMAIKQLRIRNFKRFRSLDLDFDDGMNILVGDNDAGKSTILEAIHLAATGILGGRYLRNELSQHLFNNESVAEYLASVKDRAARALPEILIEVFLVDGKFPGLEGDDNSTKAKATGFYLKVHFDEYFKDVYSNLIGSGDPLLTLPIEFYTHTYRSFAREGLSTRGIPIKSALVDSSAPRHQNGSDVYVSRLVRDLLDSEDIVGISQAYRKMKESFRSDDSIAAVNKKVKEAARISSKEVSLSAELPAKSDWEESLVTCVEDVPFQYIGKGEQCLIKTKLALHDKKAKTAAVILLEEPENHLTHAGLNGLLNNLTMEHAGKQIILSTHSSFVANKLGLDRLMLLHGGKVAHLGSLPEGTMQFFQKIAGYDTLRLILAKRAILVEGDSDELVVQKAYLITKGKLPIEDGVDVISVGTSFLRFMAVADKIGKPIAVVTDNDGDVAALEKKYANYLGARMKKHVQVCFDHVVDTGTDIDGKAFNYNTLEPKLLKENGRDNMNKNLGTSFESDEDLCKYMRANKTECALKVFETKETVRFPKYILDSIG